MEAECTAASSLYLLRMCDWVKLVCLWVHHFFSSFSVIRLWVEFHFLGMSLPLCSVYYVWQCPPLSFGFLHIKLVFVFILCLCPRPLALLPSLFHSAPWPYHSLQFQWLVLPKRVTSMISVQLGTLFWPPEVALQSFLYCTASTLQPGPRFSHCIFLLTRSPIKIPYSVCVISF